MLTFDYHLACSALFGASMYLHTHIHTYIYSSPARWVDIIVKFAVKTWIRLLQDRVGHKKTFLYSAIGKYGLK